MNPSRPRRLSGLVSLGALLAIIAVLSPRVARAQLATASINGVIKDSAGGVVPGATVLLKNVATNVTETARTNNAGVYAILNVPPGNYTLQVSKTGFQTKTQSQFTLAVNQTASFDFVLGVGSALQTVTVQAVAPALQTSSAELGTVVASRQVNDLPLNGRNFTQLLDLTPGVSTINTSQNAGNKQFTGNPIGNYSFPSVNGQTNRSNFYLVDGLNDQESFSSTYSVAPIVDDIQEFKVDSHNDQAQFGGVLGGVVNVVTKSGTNQLHGGAWEFFRNTALNSRNPFNSGVSQLQQNEFGANVGGPVVLPHYNGRNRTFFFGSYEGARIHSGSTSQTVVPTAPEIASGDFSDFSGQIYNPYSTNPATLARQPFMCNGAGAPLAAAANGTQAAGTPCNLIPASLIDPHMQALAKKLWPTPNVIGNPSFNYQTNLLDVHNSDNYSIRGDEQLGTTNSFWFRFAHVGSPDTSDTVLGNNGEVLYNAHWWGLSWNHTFGPSAILTLQMGRNFANGVSASLFSTTEAQALISAAGISSFLTCGYLGTRSCYFPAPDLTNGGLVNGGESDNNTNVADIWEWKGDFSKIHGKHTLSMGADFNTNGMTQLIAGSHFDFSSDVTSNPAAPKGSQGGYSVASFLLGVPSGSTYRNVNETEYGGWVDGFYFQDQWKATDRLTVNLGGRYDVTFFPVYGSAKDKNNQIGDLDLDNGTYILEATAPPCGTAPCIPGGTLPPNVLVTNRSNGSIVHNTYDNIQPRFGLAYRLRNRTVLRASFGRFFDNWAAVTQMAQNFQGTWPSVSQQILSNLNTITPTTLAENLFAGGGTGAVPAPTPFEQNNWFVDPLIQNPYSYQWNFGVQEAFTPDTTLTVNYVGSDGHRLDSGTNGNVATVPGVGPVPSAGCYNTTCTPAIVAAEKRFPYPYQVITSWETSHGESWYNALQISLNKRASRGLTYLLSYTWSKDEDLGVDGWFGADGASVEHPYNLWADKSVSSYDLTHIFAASAVYQLPFGKGMRFRSGNPVVDNLVGGWQLNGILTLASGQPYTIAASSSILNTGAQSERANLVGNPGLSNPSVAEWFNTAAFAAPQSPGALIAAGLPVTDAYGDLGRNTMRGDGRPNLDLSLFRSFQITESKRFEFRAEAFDATNNPIFSNPDANVNDPVSRFGRVFGTANSPRILQFALKFYF